MVNEKSRAVGVNIQENTTTSWNVADVLLSGRSLTPPTFVIAKADMTIRGGDPNNIRFGDQFPGFSFQYKDFVEDKVHKVLSQRLNDIYDMFRQKPDTLEDVWIDVATNNVEQAMERINC